MSNSLSSPSRVLLVDDDADIRKAASLLLGRHGFEIVVAANPEEAWSALAATNVDVVLLDLNFGPGAVTGAEGLRCLKGLTAHDPDVVVVVVTGHSGINIAVAAMRAGAADFVMKPWNNERLLATLRDAAALRRRRLDASSPSQSLPDNAPMIGESPAMQRVEALTARIAATNAPILITGEPGVGKNLLAQLIHRRSRRAHFQFTALDPLALWSEGEASLSAVLAAADPQGSLLLDSVGNWPMALQARLLAFLSTHPELRLMAASRHDRAELQASLNADLFYRLSTVEIALPPLRAREGDIRRLANYFLDLYAHYDGRPNAALTEESHAVLERALWPGNVRELRQAIERAVVLSPGDALRPEDLFPSTTPAVSAEETDLNLLRSERSVVEAALKRHGFNVTRAAKELGLTRAALYRRMARHGF